MFFKKTSLNPVIYVATTELNTYVDSFMVTCKL